MGIKRKVKLGLAPNQFIAFSELSLGSHRYFEMTLGTTLSTNVPWFKFHFAAFIFPLTSPTGDFHE